MTDDGERRAEAISEDIIHLQKDVNLLKWIASINTAMLIALLAFV